MVEREAVSEKLPGSGGRSGSMTKGNKLILSELIGLKADGWSERTRLCWRVISAETGTGRKETNETLVPDEL